jgi:hypothetical protein
LTETLLGRPYPGLEFVESTCIFTDGHTRHPLVEAPDLPSGCVCFKLIRLEPGDR